MLLWLNDRSGVAFAKAYLIAQSGTGTDINGAPKPFTRSGLQAVYPGAEYVHASPSDPRVPDLVGVAQYGVVYTGGKGKIAEHGGAAGDDRDVPLVVTGERGVVSTPVETTQIAPTILSLLHLNPAALDAVRAEHTQLLPEEG